MKANEGVERVGRARGGVSGEMKRKEGEGEKCGCGKVKTMQGLLTKKMISKKKENEHGENKSGFYSRADRVVSKLHAIYTNKKTDD